jgi:hypothetical protein
MMPLAYAGPPPTSSALYRWGALSVEAAQKTGRPLTNVQHYARWMREIGFEDVHEERFHVPTSLWPKAKHLKLVGRYFQADLLLGIDAMSMMLFTSVLGWSAERLKAFTEEVLRDIRDASIHAYMPL